MNILNLVFTVIMGFSLKNLGESNFVGNEIVKSQFSFDNAKIESAFVFEETVAEPFLMKNLGFEFSFKNRSCTISRNGLCYASASFVNGLYVIDQGTPINNINTKRLRIGDSNACFLWHCRLGHINEKRIKKLQEDGLLGFFDWESMNRCESCLLGKMTIAPFNKNNERTT